MDHGLDLIIPILEILEIGVCNILQKPGNIGKRIFLIQSYPGNIGNVIFFNFPISWKYWKSDSSIFSYPGNTGGGRAEAGGRLQGLCCAALDYFWNMFPGISGYPGNIGNIIFLDFCDFFLQKRRAPKFHAEWSGFRGEISHLRPIQGQKLKLFQPPILPLVFPSSKPLATTMTTHEAV